MFLVQAVETPTNKTENKLTNSNLNCTFHTEACHNGRNNKTTNKIHTNKNRNNNKKL